MIQIDHRMIAEALAGAVTTGVPIGLAIARHMPAPLADSIYYAWIFDTVQDLAKNNDRIGLRRPHPVALQPDVLS